MGKHSKRNRRRLHQSGLGGGLSIASQLPMVSRGRIRAAELSPEAKERVKIVRLAQKRGVAAAMEAFEVSRATVYRWLTRYNPQDLRTLESRSRRPHRTRKKQWTPEQEQAVVRLREGHPRFGKMKLAVLLAAEGITLSASTIGRILASLKRRNLLIEPWSVPVRNPKPARPSATRVPKDKRTPTMPGQLVQLDTMHLRPLPGVERRQFTAVDVVSRCAVVGVRSQATAGTAAAFLDELVDRMPFPVQAILTRWRLGVVMAEFETACQAREIALYVLPPRSPKLNGCVERLNGTARREFWECYGGDLDLPTLQPALRQWEVSSNTERPHQSLEYLTPTAWLQQHPVSHVSD